MVGIMNKRGFSPRNYVKTITKLVDTRAKVGSENLKCHFWFLSESSSVAAVQSCFCFIIVAAAIVLGIGALFLLFVLLYSQRVASQSCETLGELLHHPAKEVTFFVY